METGKGETSTKRNAAIIAVVVVLVAAILASLPLESTNTPSSSSGSSSRSATNATASYQVVKENLTVYYGTACMIVYFEGFGCPTYNPASHSPSLGKVDLVDYQGNNYYDINFTGCVNARCGITTIWFTNSTIFCSSPSSGGYTACPVSPFRPYDVAPGQWSISSLNSSSGLALDLQVVPNPNGTAGIEVKVDDFNTLPSINNVTASDSWPSIRPLTNHICESAVVDFVMYRGEYASGNLTLGSTLQLSSPGSSANCVVASPPTYFSFPPKSDSVSVLGGDTSGLQFKTASLSILVEGYWTGSNSNTATLVPFSPGIYTVVAMDQWGALAILHFTVEG